MTSSKSSSIVLRGLKCTMTDECLVTPSPVFVNNAGLAKYCVPLTCTVERSWLQCLGILYLANALDTLVGSHANFRVGECTDFKQVVKAIWQKGCIAAAHGWFSGIRQVAPVCTPPNTCFLRPTKSTTRTATRSVELFSHSSPHSVIRHV